LQKPATNFPQNRRLTQRSNQRQSAASQYPSKLAIIPKVEANAKFGIKNIRQLPATPCLPTCRTRCTTQCPPYCCNLPYRKNAIPKIPRGRSITTLPFRRNIIPNTNPVRPRVTLPQPKTTQTCPAVCQFACKAECPFYCCRHRTTYPTGNNPRSYIPTRVHTLGRKSSRCPDACKAKCRTFCPWQCCLIPYRRSYMKP
jgi:hypothetical protein